MPHGYPLDAVSEFPREYASKLREELSVRTAEQFVDLSTHHRDQIARLLEIEPRQLDELCSRAASVIDASDLEDILHPAIPAYSYTTGHDAPVDGETFYKGESKDD
ncbi:MAG TPA: hypothetical protein VEK57_18010 [Thermoanaerobaculia bacterium]|nr:hypothetical protein [Thermoanaerobaculia bacterium]